MITRALIAGIVGTVLLARPAAAQREDGDYRSSIDTTIAFDSTGFTELTLVSGDIIVQGWSQNSVKIHATSEHGLLELDASRSRITLGVRSDRGRMGDTRYEVSVPYGSTVITRSVSGDIQVTGTRGETELHSVSGDLTLRDAGNRATIETVSGEVRAETVKGATRASSVSGDVVLEDLAGDVEVESVSGDVRIQDSKARYARARSVSGDIEFVGPVDCSGRYDFHSHSGDVRLTLPASTGGHFSVETFSGDIDSDFPMTLLPGSTMGKRFEFTIGSCAADIVLGTFSGDINLARGDAR